jgi:hypothetical protein
LKPVQHANTHHIQNPFTTSHTPFAKANVAGWSSPVARQAHNLKVTGSNPVPATILIEQPLPPFRAALSLVPSYVAFELLRVRDGGDSIISAERSTFFFAA